VATVVVHSLAIDQNFAGSNLTSENYLFHLNSA